MTIVSIALYYQGVPNTVELVYLSLGGGISPVIIQPRWQMPGHLPPGSVISSAVANPRDTGTLIQIS